MSDLPDTIFQQGRCMICGAVILPITPTNASYYGHDKYRSTSQIDWKETHKAYHDNMVSREEAKKMSSVLWCDNGNHAFEAGIEGSQSGRMEENTVDNQGNPITRIVTVDYCPDHTPATLARKAAEAAAKSILAEAAYGSPLDKED